ncbi:MAG: hypothetical protein IJ131_06255 [Eggerthellaceae bacterium]|nr:hypothetical protein [Eggerthellaceae bacterium]
MKTYKTAHIEVVSFDEDVITASGVNSTSTPQCFQIGDNWLVQTETTNYTIPGPDKPDVCP